MKKRIILIIGLLVLIPLIVTAKVTYPTPTQWVNDFAGVLSSSTVKQLNNLALEIKQKTGFELAVAVVKDMQGGDHYTYANKLYEKWGVGTKDDEGCLILIAIDERKLKIEVGYGAEGFITDGLAGEIADTYMIPYLKNNNWDEGLIQGYLALASVVGKHYGVQFDGVPEGVYQIDGKPDARSIIKFIIGFIIFLLIFGGRMGFLPFLFLGGMGGGRSSGGSWSSGSGGFGGFGGFGGGMSGGGGIGRGF
ncbi:MAG: TPM domain-containing protein [Candidatus Cloacimonetes bacterium]|nr:TPM domain-containing protein [Candidatus Cloacimonadota bacterium]